METEPSLDPYRQLKKSLMRSFVICLCLLGMAVFFVKYFEYQYKKTLPPAIFNPHGDDTNIVLPPHHSGAFLNQLSSLAVGQSDPATTNSTPIQPIIQQFPPGTSPEQKQEELKDIKPPVFYYQAYRDFIASLWLCLLLLAVLVILALIAFLIFYLWKQKSAPTPLTAYELTCQKLRHAQKLLEAGDAEPYAREVSEIIRTYLGWRFDAPSTKQTTEEFLRLMERTPESPMSPHRELLQQFLQSCDLVKFARYQPTQRELQEVHASALRFVEATKPVLELPKPVAANAPYQTA